jgi:hypothetical protein
MFINKKARVSADDKLRSGVETHLKPEGVFLDGRTHTRDELVTMFSERTEATRSAQVAKAAYEKAVADERAKLEETNPTVYALREVLHLMYRSQFEVLADFGLSRRKDRKDRTLEEKAKTLEKMRATRRARRTVGPKKRLEIHGDAPE